MSSEMLVLFVFSQALQEVNGQVDVRFFGAHDMWVLCLFCQHSDANSMQDFAVRLGGEGGV